jgi:hypothetical protein
MISKSLLSRSFFYPESLFYLEGSLLSRVSFGPDGRNLAVQAVIKMTSRSDRTDFAQDLVAGGDEHIRIFLGKAKRRPNDANA